jgi:hypothetical protein
VRADRVPGHSVRGVAAGRAGGLLTGAPPLPGVAGMAPGVAKAQTHRAAAGLSLGTRATVAPVVAAGTHGGHPAGGAWSFRRALMLSTWIRRPGRSFVRYRAT